MLDAVPLWGRGKEGVFPWPKPPLDVLFAHEDVDNSAGGSSTERRFRLTFAENPIRTIRNPTMYTMGTAAKATGKAKSTISMAINKGRISATKNEDGVLFHRPCRAASGFSASGSANGPEKPDLDDLEPFDLRFENGRLQGELQLLRERMAGIDTLHERERQQLTDQIEDLRRRLDQSEQERREKDRQLTALLTDERPKAEAPPPMQAGASGRGFSRRSRSA